MLDDIGIPLVALRALNEKGYKTVENLNDIDDEDILSLKGVGETTLKKIRNN